MIWNKEAKGQDEAERKEALEYDAIRSIMPVIHAPGGAKIIFVSFDFVTLGPSHQGLGSFIIAPLVVSTTSVSKAIHHYLSIDGSTGDADIMNHDFSGFLSSNSSVIAWLCVHGMMRLLNFHPPSLAHNRRPTTLFVLPCSTNRYRRRPAKSGAEATQQQYSVSTPHSR